MSVSPNRKRISIDLKSDWTLYQKSSIPGFEIIGIVSRGSESPGALARNIDSGIYVQLNDNVVTDLIQRKVIKALNYISSQT